MKDKTGLKITKAGYDYLSQAITNVHGNVYAFNNTLSPLTIAAAMARLSVVAMICALLYWMSLPSR